MGTCKEAGAVENSPRDDVEFLVSSWNRLDILNAVAGAPRTRDELRGIVSVSRVTLSRILSDLETRDWIVREGDRYRATRAGVFVASELMRTLANIRTLNQLGDHAAWIRLEQLDFDLSRLHGADVITPTWDDFSAQTSTLVDLAYECRHLRAIETGLDRQFIDAVADATVHGPLSADLLFEPGVFETIAEEPELTALFRGLAASEDATMYRYEGDEPLVELTINETRGEQDDVVMLCGDSEDGAPPGTVKTTDEAVLAWAEAHFEARRYRSRTIETEAFNS